MATYSQSYKGLYPTNKGTSLNVREKANDKSTILTNLTGGKTPGMLTGYYGDTTDGRWLQIYLSPALKGKSYGYVREDVTKLLKSPSGGSGGGTTTVTDEQAQKLIDRLVESDKQLYFNLVKISYWLKELDKKGVDLSKSKALYKQLLLMLAERQNMMNNSNALTCQKGMERGWTEISKNWEYYLMSATTGNYLTKDQINQVKSAFNVKGIGVAQAVIIVGAIIVGAVAAAVVYKTFKPKYDESVANLKVSNDLAKALESVDSAVSDKIKADLEKQIDDAYNQGQTDQRFKSIFKILTPIGLLIGGYYVITHFIASQTNKKKSRK